MVCGITLCVLVQTKVVWFVNVNCQESVSTCVVEICYPSQCGTHCTVCSGTPN